MPHSAVGVALDNVVTQVDRLDDVPGAPLPLLLVRTRTPDQVREVARRLGSRTARLTGFVLPKFLPGPAGEAWFDALDEASWHARSRVFGLPVLEHERLAWLETRDDHLAAVRALLDGHRDAVLCVRVGATDLGGLFGLRRDRETTIWDVAVVRDALAHVLNVFTRRGDYVVSGPVWEHFSSGDRLLRPQLRRTPFEHPSTRWLREELLDAGLDALLREVQLDRANGFVGKTVIHPTHVGVVNAMQAVTEEEYDDAVAVRAAAIDGGVLGSAAGNKMNEAGPHALWADQVLDRAAVYGVLKDHAGVVDLVEAGWRAATRPTPPDPVAVR